MSREFEWEYKDSYRMYWLITAKETTEIGGKDNGEYYETEWEVSIYRDVSEATEESSCLFDGFISTQYDEPISLNEILAYWANYNQNVMFGMIKFARREIL
jgi:hypothetical protein